MELKMLLLIICTTRSVILLNQSPHELEEFSSTPLMILSSNSTILSGIIGKGGSLAKACKEVKLEIKSRDANKIDSFFVNVFFIVFAPFMLYFVSKKLPKRFYNKNGNISTAN